MGVAWTTRSPPSPLLLGPRPSHPILLGQPLEELLLGRNLILELLRLTIIASHSIVSALTGTTTNHEDYPGIIGERQSSPCFFFLSLLLRNPNYKLWNKMVHSACLISPDFISSLIHGSLSYFLFLLSSSSSSSS